MSHSWTRWFLFFRFLQISSNCVGLKRQNVGSDTAGGPRHDRFTMLNGSQRCAIDRRAETYTLDTKYGIEDHSHGDGPKWRSPQMLIANIVILLVTSMSDVMSINTTALSPWTPNTRQFVAGRLLKLLQGVYSTEMALSQPQQLGIE